MSVSVSIPPITTVPRIRRPDRAGPGGGPQRHAAQDERERGHEEGAPPHPDAFERGVDERHAPLVRDLGELDDEDRVLGGEADHHEQADLREDVELEAAEPQRSQGAEHGDGRGEQDGERQASSSRTGRP